MSTRTEMTEQEMRAMRVWEQRILRPTASKTCCSDLKLGMQEAYRRFRDALVTVPTEHLDMALGEGRMSSAELWAHLSVVLRWQAEKVREIETGRPTRDGAFADFFAEIQGRSLDTLRADFDDAWQALEQAISACSEETTATATHPWFGALDLREWIVSISAHFDYHRAQIEKSAVLAP